MTFNGSDMEPVYFSKGLWGSSETVSSPYSHTNALESLLSKALTPFIMSRTVHHCPCGSNTWALNRTSAAHSNSLVPPQRVALWGGPEAMHHADHPPIAPARRRTGAATQGPRVPSASFVELARARAAALPLGPLLWGVVHKPPSARVRLPRLHEPQHPLHRRLGPPHRDPHRHVVRVHRPRQQLPDPIVHCGPQLQQQPHLPQVSAHARLLRDDVQRGRGRLAAQRGALIQ
mmetsp:Transcript_33392/g.55894  ORF Transcript_33392/g.55894 Transcript_33392/m.55894 type:complete len:232 (-) Transcript_33392:377-1072(-)